MSHTCRAAFRRSADPAPVGSCDRPPGGPTGSCAARRISRHSMLLLAASSAACNTKGKEFPAGPETVETGVVI